jgi:type II secretory pathway component PulF
MKLFYIAATTDGKRVRGFIDAADISKAAIYLREHALLPIRIEQQTATHLFNSFKGLHKISDKDIIFLPDR